MLLSDNLSIDCRIGPPKMDQKGAAVLFSEMTPGPGFEAEFNTWYHEEHAPLRTACAGFVSACHQLAPK
jgi:hypothetical protein